MGDIHVQLQSQAERLFDISASSTNAENIIKAIMTGGSISESIVQPNISGLSNDVENARDYAKTDYVLGLPNNSHSSYDQITDENIANTILLEKGLVGECTIPFNITATLSAATVILPLLVDTRHFDVTTGYIDPEHRPAEWELPTEWNDGPVGYNIKVQFIELQNSNTEVLITYYATVYSVQRDNSNDLHWTPYVFDHDKYTQDFSEVYVIPSEYQLGNLYRIVAYTIGEETNWWYYNMLSGKYPELDLNQIDNAPLDGYPVVPIRYDNEFISPDNNPEIYSGGSEVLTLLGVDFDTIVTALDDNEYIEEIDHAYVLFAIDLNTEVPVSLKYLVEFFTYLSLTDNKTVWDSLSGSTATNTYSFGPSITDSQSSGTSVLDLYNTDNSITSTVINPTETLSLVEHGLDISLSYDSITSILLSGSIGSIGSTTKTIEYTEEIPVYKTETISAGHGGNSITYVAWTEIHDILVLKYQVNTTTYREVRVTNLKYINHIYGHDKYSIIGYPSDILDPDNTANFMIPLSYAVIQTLPNSELNTFYADAVFLMINSVVVTEEKWYQNGYFQFGVMAIAMYAGAYYMGPFFVKLSGLLLAIEIGTAGAIMELVTFLGVYVLDYVALQLVADIAIQVLGPNIGFIIGMVALVFGYGTKGLSLLGTITSADILSSFGMKLLSAANDAINDLIKNIDTQYSELMIDQVAKQEVLDTAYNLLNTEYLLPWSYLDEPDYPTYDEKSDVAYFYSPIHIGNIGTLTLDVIENYVSMMLILPGKLT